MTTSVTILNNGPDDVEVTVAGWGDDVKHTIKPGEFLDGRQYSLYVHQNQSLIIKEVDRTKNELSPSV